MDTIQIGGEITRDCGGDRGKIDNTVGRGGNDSKLFYRATPKVIVGMIIDSSIYLINMPYK